MLPASGCFGCYVGRIARRHPPTAVTPTPIDFLGAGIGDPGCLWLSERNGGGCGRCAQVAEWLMAADCKSAALRSYGGSNPPLCTRGSRVSAPLADMSMGEMPRARRKWIALAILAALAGLAWKTMEPG